MPNLTGVPNTSIWGDLNLAGSTMEQLSEEEKLARKKKIMSAGQTNDFQNAIQNLFGRTDFDPYKPLPRGTMIPASPY